MGIPLTYDLIRYRRVPVWKYVLHRDYTLQTTITPFVDVNTKYIRLTKDGLLTVKAGYAWDGCSGPTHDDYTNQRAGLVHDALYALIREGWLNRDKWRQPADRLLYDLCREDGMAWLRARAYYRGVRLGGEQFTHPESAIDLEKIYSAP